MAPVPPMTPRTRRGLGHRFGLFAIALLVGTVWACKDDAMASLDDDTGQSDAGDVSEDRCPFGTIEPDFCLPEPPRPTPAEDCPSGRFGEQGICIPSPPMLTDWDCPEGWAPEPALGSETDNDDSVDGVPSFSFCVPPEPAAECPTGFMPLVGRSDCVQQGIACPAEGEPWHEEATIRDRAEGFEGSIHYVLTTADPGGDGTRQQPLDTIAAALDIAADGDIVALAEGEYAETVLISRPLALVGACSAGTRVVSPSPGPAPMADLSSGAGALLSDLTISGERPGVLVRSTRAPISLVAVTVEAGGETAIEVRSAQTVRLIDVVVGPHAEGGGVGLEVNDATTWVERSAVLGNVGLGVFARGATTELAMTDVIVADTQPLANNLQFGRGLDVESGARVALERVAVLRNHDFGVFAAGQGIDVSLTDVLVADTQPRPFDDDFGMGLSLQDGARVTLLRVALLRNHDAGIVENDDGTELLATDVVVADTQPGAGRQELGRGLDLFAGARAVIQQGAFLRNHSQGVLAIDPGTSLTLTDVIVADTQPQRADRAFGTGLHLADGAGATLSRVAVVRNLTFGVNVLGDGTALAATDLNVVDTRSQQSDASLGAGLTIWLGAQGVVQRGAFTNNHAAGVAVFDRGTALDLRDALVTDTQIDPSTGFNGAGALVAFGATATLERTAFLRNHDVALQATHRGTELRATDLWASDTAPIPDVPLRGRGLEVGLGAQAHVERAELSGNHSAAVYVGDAGTAVTLADVRVTDTRVTSIDDVELGGSGFVVVTQSDLDMQRFVVTGSEQAGVLVAEGSRLYAEEGMVTENLIGLSIQDSDFDVLASFVRVLNLGNVIDLDYSALPVPETGQLADQFDLDGATPQ